MRPAWMAGAVLAAALAGAAGLLLWPATMPEPAGSALRILRGGAEVEVSGPLASGLAAPLRDALARGARTVQLDSPGGPPAAADAITAEIRAAGADTAVTDRCLSACVAVFMGGRQRWIGPFSQMGLEARHAGTSLLDLYRRAGLPATLVREAAATPDGEAWFPTIGDLRLNGMATATAAPDQFALAGFGPAPTTGSIRARVLAVPLYRAAAAADPQAFDADLAVWRDAVLRGEPGTEAFARTRSTVRALVDRALPDASDGLLLEHADLFLAEIAWVRQHRPDACAGPSRWDPAGIVEDADLGGRRAALDLRIMQELASGPRRAAVPAGRASMMDCLTTERRWTAAGRDVSALRDLARQARPGAD